MPLYIASYGVSFLLMGGASIGLFTGLSKGINRGDLPQFAEFSAFSLFAGGAVIVATQLDYIMVGKFLGLEEVPVYTLGFFMGSVVALPRRATTNIVRGRCRKNQPRRQREHRPTQQEHRTGQLLAHGSRHAGIWAGFDPLQQLLPPKYRGLELVFLCIAGAQLISGLNVSNNNHLGLSKHYRLVLPINLAPVVVTVAMNYPFLVVPEWGLAGAALATLGTLWNNAWRVLIVYRKFGVHPFTGLFPSCRGSPLRLRCFSTGTPNNRAAPAGRSCCAGGRRYVLRSVYSLGYFRTARRTQAADFLVAPIRFLLAQPGLRAEQK